MSDLEFEVAKRDLRPITFKLGDDHEYVFTPPKTAAMLMPILDPSGEDLGMDLTRATFDWLGDGLSDEDNDLILERLRDPADDLDSDTLTAVVTALSEKVSGRPTT